MRRLHYASHPALELKTWSALQHLGTLETTSTTEEIRGAADATGPPPPALDILAAEAQNLNCPPMMRHMILKGEAALKNI